MWIVTQKNWLVNSNHISSIFITTKSSLIDGEPKETSDIYAVDHKNNAEYVFASYDTREEALIGLGLLLNAIKERKPAYNFN